MLVEKYAPAARVQWYDESTGFQIRFQVADVSGRIMILLFIPNGFANKSKEETSAWTHFTWDWI